MAKTNTLAEFSFEPSEDAQSAQIHIRDDKGGKLELTASREQLELLADSLDDFLAETESADEVDDDEDDEDDDAFDDDEGDEGEQAEGEEAGGDASRRAPARR